MRPSGGWRDSACPHTPGTGQRGKYCGVRGGQGAPAASAGDIGGFRAFAAREGAWCSARRTARCGGRVITSLWWVSSPRGRGPWVGLAPKAPGSWGTPPRGVGRAAAGSRADRANCGGQGPGGAGAAPIRPAGGVCGAGTGSLQPGRKAARKGQETESLRRATACHFRHSWCCLRPRPPRGPGELAPVCRVPWACQL